MIESILYLEANYMFFSNKDDTQYYLTKSFWGASGKMK